MTRSKTSVATPPSSKPSKKKKASVPSTSTKRKKSEAKRPDVGQAVHVAPDLSNIEKFFQGATTFESYPGEWEAITEEDADKWDNPYDDIGVSDETKRVTLDDLKSVFWPKNGYDDEGDNALSLPHNIDCLSAIIHDIAIEKGWWDGVTGDASIEDRIRSVKDKLLMIHTEVSEATEELRVFDKDKPYASLSDEEFERDGKPVGFATELADILIRTMDLMAFIGADIGGLMYDKIRYNMTRPHRHGGKNL